MNPNTKTTILGIIAAIAAATCTPQAIAIEPGLMHTIGSWILAVGLGMLGLHSAGTDNSGK